MSTVSLRMTNVALTHLHHLSLHVALQAVGKLLLEGWMRVGLWAARGIFNGATFASQAFRLLARRAKNINNVKQPDWRWIANLRTI